MSKVITFSRAFPNYHPKAGQPTFFVEQILTNLKKHTIRKGKRFKVGDKFSPRVWSGAPYKSKQIIIAPDIEVKKVYTFSIKQYDVIDLQQKFFIDFGSYSISEDMDLHQTILPYLAKNDGLSLGDFVSWFNFPKKEFQGQIICWSDDVSY